MGKIDELIKKYCPNGVEYRELGEIGQLYNGLSDKTKDDFNDGNCKYITYMNVFTNLSVDPKKLEFVNIDSHERQNRVEYGDVLFTASSETPDECGMSCVYMENSKESVYLNSFCFGFRLNNKAMFFPGFLKYLFRDEKIRKQIKKTASGVTRFNVSKARFIKIRIPIPTIEIQKEIACVLEKFTDLVSELEIELQMREKQYEHYRNQLLDFNKEQLEFKGRMKWSQLGELCDFYNGKGHEKNISSEGKYIVVNSRFISRNGEVIKRSKEQLSPVFKDDILMVMSDLPNGKALAKCFIVDKDDTYTLNQRICSLRIKDTDLISVKFFYYQLNRNSQLLRYDNGADQTNLRKEDILKIDIPVPPMKIQNEIVIILDQFEKLIHDKEEGLPAEIEKRKQQFQYYSNRLLDFKELEKGV